MVHWCMIKIGGDVAACISRSVINNSVSSTILIWFSN